MEINEADVTVRFAMLESAVFMLIQHLNLAPQALQHLLHVQKELQDIPGLNASPAAFPLVPALAASQCLQQAPP